MKPPVEQIQSQPHARERGAPSRPLVGVTTSEVRTAKEYRRVREGERAQHEMALGLAYMRALELGGAVPVVLPPLTPESIDPALDQVTALCLSGGPDLDPKTYAQEADPNLGPTWPELDFVELCVARGADRRHLPVFAICRGMQALNVARGGTLVQHLPDADGAIAHRQDAPGWETSHSVRIEPGSRLAEIVGATEIEVNSFHHQAIDELGENLRPVAWSPDGVIEAVEATDRAFTIGVQWHAEGIVDRPEQLALHQAFVSAANAHRDGAD